MKFKALALIVAFSGFGAAYAQPQPGASTPAPLSPAQEAARQAMHKACATDSATLCPGVDPHQALACMRKIMDKLSPACRQSILDLPPGPGRAPAAPPPSP
jgi:hypothetical protein